MKKRTLMIAFVLGAFVMNIQSCKKDEDDEPTVIDDGGLVGDTTGASAKTTDEILLDMAKVTTGFKWFKNNDTLLGKSSGSGHVEPFLRTRYNSIAQSFLNSSGVVLDSAKFSEGSLIVKELINADKSINRYAILYKQSNHADADANGWVWGYMDADGTIASPASNKGGSCTGCHSQGGNIDYMLMNKFYP